MSSEKPFWEQPENVERFATREPDHRLKEVVDAMTVSEGFHALDLGCAGGRNTVLLAERECSVWALDSSQAMVEKTRQRLALFIGEAKASAHVVKGSMTDLSRFADGFFDLIVALGIYHNAESRQEWNEALSETSRVLASGGELLVAVFTPETDLTGEGVTAVEGEPLVYDGFPSGRAVLMDEATLEREMARYDLTLAAPAEVVTTPRAPGQRVSINALYRKL
jgi:ubiquinone/menaquinone biosynthesis C-methylase UbiE